MAIHWSDHALTRLVERFGDEGWRIVPAKKIRSKAESATAGEQFRVRKGPVVYVCSLSHDGIVVLIVFRKIDLPKES